MNQRCSLVAHRASSLGSVIWMALSSATFCGCSGSGAGAGSGATAGFAGSGANSGSAGQSASGGHSSSGTGGSSTGSGGSSTGSGGSSTGGSSTGGATGTGGSAGTGATGTGGSGGALTVTPGDCSNLPAKGQWQNVSPPNSNYTNSYTGINAIVGRPDTPGTIFAGADTNGFYRSDDCGATWRKVNTGRNANALGSGRPWSLAIDPVTPDVMYIVEGYGTSGLFKTTNAGVDWDQVLTSNITAAFYGGGQITGISIDPTDHQHLVIESHGGSGCGQNTCIAESTDSGTTWKLIQIPTGWAENSSVAIIDRKTWLYPTLFGGLWRTSDQGATWAQVTGHSASANYYEPFVWKDSGGRYYIPSPSGLIASKPNDTSSWSQVADSHGLTLMPTGTQLVMSSEFSMNYYVATRADPTKWSSFTAPPQTKTSSQGGGGVYLLWDGSHHVLYSSNFDAGLWRIVTD